jgi:hypothetical protein
MGMRTTLAFAFIALALPAEAEESRPHQQGLYAVTRSVSLELVLPATWGTGSRPNDDGRPDSALFAPAPSKGFTLLVSPFPAPPSALGPQGSRAMAGKMRGGIESAGPIREFRGERRVVHWFTTPTRNPGPGDYLWLTAGATALEGTLVTFNLLHDAEVPPDLALVLQALGRAREVDPQRTHEAGTVSLVLAGKPWALLVDIPGLAVDKGGGLPDGSAMIQGHNGETGITASIFLQPAPGPGGPAECRAAYFEKALLSPLEKTGVVRSERGAMAIGEYLVPRAEGREVHQKHVNAYLVRDGVWIDVHLSKVAYQPSDQELFERALSSIRYSDR